MFHAGQPLDGVQASKQGSAALLHLPPSTHGYSDWRLCLTYAGALSAERMKPSHISASQSTCSLVCKKACFHSVSILLAQIFARQCIDCVQILAAIAMRIAVHYQDS